MSTIKKLIFFGDSQSFITTICFESLLKKLKCRDDVRLVALVNTLRKQPKYDKYAVKILKYFIKHTFNSKKKLCFHNHRSFIEIASRKLPNIPILIPSGRDINNPHFIDEIRSCNPDVGLVIGCPQKFSSELLKSFSRCVNYHNSLLPQYRGLYATAFSVYYEEKKTGYTYHIMNENFDDGNILIQGSILVGNNSVRELEMQKAIEASKKLNEVMDLLLSSGKGIPQKGEESYFGKKELEEHITVNDLNSVDLTEIRKKLRVFRMVKIIYQGELFNVTDIDFHKNQLRIKKISHLPVWLYKIYRLFLEKNNVTIQAGPFTPM